MSVELSNKIFNEFVKHYLRTIKVYTEGISRDDLVEYLMSAKIYNVSDCCKDLSDRIIQAIYKNNNPSLEELFAPAFKGRTTHTRFDDTSGEPQTYWEVEGTLGIDHPVFAYRMADKRVTDCMVDFIMTLPFSDRAIFILGSARKNFEIINNVSVRVVCEENLLKIYPLLPPDIAINPLTYTGDNQKDLGWLFTNMFIAYRVGTLLGIFKHLGNQEKQMFNCYSEKPEGNKYIHMRNPKTKEVSKYPFKSLFIILKNDNELSKKVQRITNSGRKIEYSFSWIVRGHWRNLHNPESIGKGISGEDVVGKTYIHSYLKGDKDAPLLKKETVVLDRRTHA